MWRTQVEPAVPVPAPEPQIQRDGGFTVAVGARQARARDRTITVQLVTVNGRGHTLGVVGIASGDEAVRELSTFFDAMKLTPAAPATPEQGSASPTARASGGLIAIEPPGFDGNRPEFQWRSFNGVRPHSIPRINMPAHSHSPFTNLLSHTTHSATIR